MDIIITGEQGAGKTSAAEKLLKAMRYSDSEILFIHDVYEARGLVREMIRAARVRVVVFDGPITRPGELLDMVKLIKDYRREINADILAVYVCPGDAVMLSDGERPSFSDNRFKECPPSHAMPMERRPYGERHDKRDRVVIASATSNDGVNWVDGEPRFAKTASLDSKVNDDYRILPKPEPQPLPDMISDEEFAAKRSLEIKRSPKILADLWDTVAEKVDEAGADLMVRTLRGLASAAGLHHLAGETAGLHHLGPEECVTLHEFLLTLLRKYE
jgi:hypothetical protein